MKFIPTDFNDAWLIEPRVFRDPRGFFFEPYSKKVFDKQGIAANFVQDNHSRSEKKGVVRGLHCQLPPCAQAKLVRVVRGAAYDVIVDLRKASPTYRKWQSFELTENNFLMLFVPRGFAHGFCTLTEGTEVIYKVDQFYEPLSDGGIRWNDPGLRIPWPTNEPVVSDKDARLPLLADFGTPF